MRIKEPKTAVAERLGQFAARKRSWLVGVKGLTTDSLGLNAARKLMYANQIGESILQVLDEAGERQVTTDD